jgi:hypothetical protein
MGILVSGINQIVEPVSSYEPDESDTTSELQAQKDDLEGAIGDAEELIRALQEFVGAAGNRISQIYEVLDERENEEAVAAE